MTRTRTLLTTAGALALTAPATVLVAAQASEAAAPSATAAAAPTVKLASTSLGKILVDKSGFTLYMFTRDKRNKDVCVTVAKCTGTWPFLASKTKPTAGPGLKASELGTIKLAHGKKQVTYDGHPLYTYAFDSSPKATDYVGAHEFGGNWYAVSATGKTIK